MKTIIFALATSVMATAVLGGCSANAADEGDAAEGAGQDVVGVTDLVVLEKSFGLTARSTQAPGSVAALHEGQCYRALIGGPAGSPKFEMRRYANGAAFFARRQGTPTTGDERPTLCVDLHAGEHADRSFSGVLLDAVARYDLGRFNGGESAMGESDLHFERGVAHVKVMDVTDAERLASVTKAPYELPLDRATSMSGDLTKLTLKGVQVTAVFDPTGPHVQDLEISGSAALIAYRYAWRKAEASGRFSIATDAVGAFARKAWTFGDGGASGMTIHFARADVAHSHESDLSSDVSVFRSDETISIGPPGRQDQPQPSQFGSCERVVTEGQAPPPFTCSGL